MDEDQIILEAAILAGLISPGEILSHGDKVKCSLILREMRAETEIARLARRITAAYLLPEWASIPAEKS